MRKFYSFLGALLVATGLFAQTNYTCTFSANVPMDSVQVKNTVSGNTKMLYSPDNVITLQKIEKTAVVTVGNSAFLQQTAINTIAVNVETASQLNFTLYSANGTVVARYANNVNAGQYTFQVGASTGVYVLVASANGQTASLKLSLQGNAQTGFFEVATAESVAFLKSADDVITFKSGDEFEFTGYYKKQTDVKTSTIAENTTIEFEFGIEKPEIFENGAIKAGFSISETKKVYFSQGNLQYQASTKTWRFAENQFDVIGTGNNNISSTYNGWIDLFGWGTSGWDSGAKSYQPYSCAANNQYYYPGGGSSPESLTGAFANADWGVYNAILNGGNQAGQWRTLTRSECEYLIKTRTNASSKKGMASVNGVNGLILLPDDWTLPEGIVFSSGVAEDNGIEYYATVNNYSLSEWSKMEANGAIFLPTTGQREFTDARNFSLFANYWLSTAATLNFPYSLCFQSDICVVTKTGPSYFHGSAVRLVQDVE